MPSPPVIFEYDPATGQTLATSIPEDLLPLSLSDIAEDGPPAAGLHVASVLDPVEPQLSPEVVPARVAPSLPPNIPPKPSPKSGEPRILNEAGKAKVSRAVKQTASMEDLAEIDKALDSGTISDSLAARLRLGPDDFKSGSNAAMPLGAQVLTPQGLLKVRKFIEQASDMERLAEVDKALNAGDVYRLQVMLNLQPQDIRQHEQEDDDYDPFTTEPTETEKPKQPKKLKAKRSKKSKGTDAPGLENLQSVYDGSSDEGHRKKQKKGNNVQENQTLVWPMSWTWLLSRTQQHPEFRPPTISSSTRWVEETESSEQPLAVAMATSLVYVGDLASGYDPRHLARVAAVDEKGKVLLDLHVRPRNKLLDCRTHITGITEEALEESFGAVTFEDVRSKFLEVLGPRTILVGHRLSADLEALQIFHGPLVDVALLFAVDTRKKYQYHPLRYIGERVLLMATKPEELELQPQDAVETARLAMRLALHESTQSVPTPAFPPREGSGRELLIRHIPASWGKEAARRLIEVLPGLGEVQVRWILNDLDPPDWRGEAVIFLSHSDARDDIFRGVKGLTDVHVQWEDAPNAPPLGAFLSEQSLIEAFSRFGMVVCARIPRRPTTQEPQSFAFVSYLEAEDAHRVSKQASVEVPITETWQLELKPRLAKYGNSSDKRVAVKAGPEDDVGFDWIHLIKRWWSSQWWWYLEKHDLCGRSQAMWKRKVAVHGRVGWILKQVVVGKES